MVKKGEFIWCIIYGGVSVDNDDTVIDLFHNYESAKMQMEDFIKRNAKTIVSRESYGPRHKSVTFITHGGNEVFVSITTKCVN